MRRYITRAALALALAGAVLATGCDILGDPPPSGRVADNVGVDPSGVNIDTSTVIPPDETEQPLTAEAPPTQAAPTPPPPKPKSTPAPAPQPKEPPDVSSGPPPTTLPNTGGSAGITHHRRASGGHSSSDSGDSGGSSGHGSSGNNGDSGE